MKNLILSILTMFALVSCQSGGQTVNKPYTQAKKESVHVNKNLEVQKVFSVTDLNKELGYQQLENGNIVFVFSPEVYGFTGNMKVFIEGSFNGWLKGIDNKWLLTPTGSDNIQTLELPYSEVAAPGNCGFPEFKFYVIHEDTLKVEEPNARATEPGFKAGMNHVLLRINDNPDEVVYAMKAMQKKKTLSEFNIRNSKDMATLTNVRKVPATKMLWRGYHPYKISRSTLDTERTRLESVKKLLKANKIQSIICLSGNESPNKRENICEYQQQIIDAGHQLYLDSSYNTVYYRSNSKKFKDTMAKIIHFINNSPAPFYVHCRLGTDRTGVVSATLAALCGAAWDEIVSDYQKTNEMGNGEYRSHRLLQYSFEKMLGKNIDSVENLAQDVTAALLTCENLTQEDIDNAVKKLTSKD